MSEPKAMDLTEVRSRCYDLGMLMRRERKQSFTPEELDHKFILHYGSGIPVNDVGFADVKALLEGSRWFSSLAEDPNRFICILRENYKSNYRIPRNPNETTVDLEPEPEDATNELPPPSSPAPSSKSSSISSTCSTCSASSSESDSVYRKFIQDKLTRQKRILEHPPEDFKPTPEAKEFAERIVAILDALGGCALFSQMQFMFFKQWQESFAVLSLKLLPAENALEHLYLLSGGRVQVEILPPRSILFHRRDPKLLDAKIEPLSPRASPSYTSRSPDLDAKGSHIVEEKVAAQPKSPSFDQQLIRTKLTQDLMASRKPLLSPSPDNFNPCPLALTFAERIVWLLDSCGGSARFDEIERKFIEKWKESFGDLCLKLLPADCALQHLRRMTGGRVEVEIQPPNSIILHRRKLPSEVKKEVDSPANSTRPEASIAPDPEDVKESPKSLKKEDPASPEPGPSGLGEQNKSKESKHRSKRESDAVLNVEMQLMDEWKEEVDGRKIEENASSLSNTLSHHSRYRELGRASTKIPRIAAGKEISRRSPNVASCCRRSPSISRRSRSRSRHRSRSRESDRTRRCQAEAVSSSSRPSNKDRKRRSRGEPDTTLNAEMDLVDEWKEEENERRRGENANQMPTNRLSIGDVTMNSEIELVDEWNE